MMDIKRDFLEALGDETSVLVVGANGFLGAHVARALAAAGFRVKTLSPTRCDIEGADQYIGRTTDLETARRALAGCERVVYLAGSSTPGHSAGSAGEDVSLELVPLVSFAEEAAKAGCTQFVFTSSGGTVYGNANAAAIPENHYLDPISVYGVNKAAAEHFLRLLARRYAMKVSVLRLSNPYGPGQLIKRSQGFVAAAMKAAFEGETLSIWGDGRTIRDFIYIDDMIDAYLAVCRLGPQNMTLNVGAGVGASLIDVCNLVERVSGRSLSIRFAPERDVDIPRNVLDIRLARQVLDWVPKTSLEAGIAGTIDWWETQLGRGSRQHEAAAQAN